MRQFTISRLTKFSLLSSIRSLTTNYLLGPEQEMFDNLDLKQLPPLTALMCTSHATQEGFVISC